MLQDNNFVCNIEESYNCCQSFKYLYSKAFKSQCLMVEKSKNRHIQKQKHLKLLP